MRRNRLLSLFASNKGVGKLYTSGSDIFIYDFIVSCRAEAEIFGGVCPEDVFDALKSIKGDVRLRINSPGGDVFGARAMEQAIREHDGVVTAQVDGYAASAASLVAVAAAKTVMAPGAMMMIHNAWTLCVGNSEDMIAAAALLEKVDGTIAASYAQKSGKDAAHFSALMAAETWMTADEAVTNGLADTVVEEKPKNAVRWNLSAFSKPPAGSEEPHAPKPDNSVETEESRMRRINAHRLRLASA